ncbi:MAG: hypothetical protein GY773_01830, partial [Actinomycetia bacterium]|nr:hypothetical protein [Actinomycetes bacterium]
QEESLTSGRVIRVAAVFGDALDDLMWPAACEFSDRVCLPAGSPMETEIDTTNAHLTGGSDTFAWLGDSMSIGAIEASFKVKPDDEIGGYRGQDYTSSLLLPSYPVSFSDGEWGSYEGEDVIALPTKITTLSPSPSRPIELGNSPLARLRWVPTGVGQMVLSMRTSTWSTERLLEDDGSVFIDTTAIRFTEPGQLRAA